MHHFHLSSVRITTSDSEKVFYVKGDVEISYKNERGIGGYRPIKRYHFIKRIGGQIVKELNVNNANVITLLNDQGDFAVSKTNGDYNNGFDFISSDLEVTSSLPSACPYGCRREAIESFDNSQVLIVSAVPREYAEVHVTIADLQGRIIKKQLQRFT